LSKLKSKFVATPDIGFWNSNSIFFIPPEAAISRSEREPDHEEMFFGLLLSSPFQISCVLDLIIINLSALAMLIPVSVINELVLFVIVVNKILLGDPETVMVVFVMEPHAGARVFVGVGVGVSVAVGIDIGV
jgi:hypothetical protein